MNLEVAIQPGRSGTAANAGGGGAAASGGGSGPPTLATRSSLASGLYWTIPQMIAHHTVRCRPTASLLAG